MTFSPLEKLESNPSSPRRPLAIMSFLMLITLGLVLGRLFELTVIHGQENRNRADENRILVRPIHAPRGVILDRNGIVLTRNVPSVREIDLPGDDLGPVAIEEAARSYPFGQALAHVVGYVGEVSPEELDECQFQKTQNTRNAGEPDIRSSGSPSFPSVPEKTSCSLSPGDIVGKSGLEKQYDFLLRGIDGAQLIEVDANGKTLRTVSTQASIPGQNLTVNLDANLSVAALSALSGKKAAVVALDPADGLVLALVSSPSFDPNLFQKTLIRPSGSPSFPSVPDILNDKVNLPLFNRPISGEYPPGSIFKLVTAAAGLSENKISQVTLIEDTGEIRVGDFRYGNWYFDRYGRIEGAINITRAIARSNDIFFYRVGEWLGPQALADWARRLGLGQKTGIDLPAEADGLIPDPGWKQRHIGEKWYLGNTYHLAIGQGDVRVTPLQVGVMTASVITGKLCQPHIATESRTLGKLRQSESQTIGMSDSRKLRFSGFLNFRPSGAPNLPGVPKINPVYAGEQLECQEVGLSQKNRDLILSGMIGACSAGGTAFPFFSWNEKGLTFADAKVRPLVPVVACKTGTAQHGGAKALPHAWIVVVAPIKVPSEGPTLVDAKVGPLDLDLDSPKRIVLVVLVEDSGEGSAVAAPIAKQILTEWFSSLTK
jgi:penicillin-binding protein 2